MNISQSQRFANQLSESIVKTFVFQREQTQQSLLLDIKISFQSDSINLLHLFQQYCPLALHKVSIYNPQTNQFCSLSKHQADCSGIVPRYLLEPQIIMVRYRQKQTANSIESDSSVESMVDQLKQKKDRSKQRTIGQAIQLVKEWRLIHLSSAKQGLKKMSLKDAAKTIGISKKSLDDYYYHLRLGQYYSFDFANNLNQKVGILRAYVKEFKPERQQKNKNLRHPKNLKIIQSTPATTPINKIDIQRNIQQIFEQLKHEEISDQISPMFQELKNPTFQNFLQFQDYFIKNGDKPFFGRDYSHEDRFFKNFDFILDEHIDPFIATPRDFKKKIFQVQQQPGDNLFFF